MGAHSFHRYVRLPTECCEQRNIQSSVHGLTRQFLTSSCVPTWSAVATDLLKFLTTISRENLSHNDDNLHNDILLPPLIAHNAGFDSRFLDHCFSRLGYNQSNGKRVIYHSLFPHTCTKQLMTHYYQQYHCRNSREGTSLESSCSVFGMDAVALRKKGTSRGLHRCPSDR
ncbi:ribonuclease T [Angomonas deanei]|nr:ribonuclease T [Angomonas deanei]|eukprot:EPY43229.1 ribonuclease T [Angomonas deanei]